MMMSFQIVLSFLAFPSSLSLCCALLLPWSVIGLVLSSVVGCACWMVAAYGTALFRSIEVDRTFMQPVLKRAFCFSSLPYAFALFITGRSHDRDVTVVVTYVLKVFICVSSV